MVERNQWGAYNFFVRTFRLFLKDAEDRGYPMSKPELLNLADFIIARITKLNGQVQGLIPADLKPYKERKPRTDDEVEKLKEEFSENLFKQMVWDESQCECGKASTGLPAPGCADCAGRGETEGRTIKCKGCAKHSLIKPNGTDDRWSCEWCKWTDTTTPDELMAAFDALGGKPKNLKSFYKTRHDDDLRSGKYVCPT